MPIINPNVITDVEIREFERKRKETLLPYEGTWVHNIPFFLVPTEVITGFRGQRFTFDEFYSSQEWSLPSHWNAAFVRDGKIVVFVYGRYSTLEKELYMTRLGSDPSFQEKGDKVIQLVLDEVEKIAREKKLEYIWTVTDRKGLDKKRSGRGTKRRDKFILENDKF